MKRSNLSELREGDVLEAGTFNELVLSTYRKNLEKRQRKERAEKKSLQ